MPNPSGVRSFSIHFDGEGADAHVLPAPVLTESIAQIQRIVLLLAKMHRGEPLGQRTSFSRALRDEFALLCHLPEAGSYAFPVEIGQQSRSDALPELVEVCDLFHRVTSSVGGHDDFASQEIVPDSRYLALLTDAYRKAQPSPQTGMSLSIEDHNHRRILDGRRPLHALDAESLSPPDEPIESTVSGLLVGMDFHKRNIRLMRLDGKVISVGYDNDAEKPLLDHRRDWITLSGEVLYDNNRKPLSVKHARDFVTLENGEIELTELSLCDVLYRAAPPLRFHVSYDTEDQLYDLDGDFEITLSAKSRPELLRELHEVLSMLWVDYAQEEPKRLSPKARDLRSELLGRLRAA
ncbi:MAG: hypothetical protein OXU70_13505 [Gammaproteobacteria bacterium]|nr:hypothetical protein [Gammaproteobacteria bacterium]